MKKSVPISAKKVNVSGDCYQGDPLQEIKEEVFWQEDWEKDVGGDNLEKLRKLNEKYYKPYGAILGRAPKRRKGYQGRVERSHKTDDEEFYIPLLSSINSERQLLQYATKGYTGTT